MRKRRIYTEKPKLGSVEWQHMIIREEYIEPAKKEKEKQTRR